MHTSRCSAVKTADAELVRLQAFVHDPVAPLLQLVHAMDDESVFTLDLDGAKKAAADAVRLLGNASAQISKLRRKVLKAVNPDIQDLAEEDIFQTAAPQLFGRDFEAKMKDRAKSIKLLAAAKPHHTPGKKKFFSKRPSHCPPERRRPLPPRGETIMDQEGQACPEVICSPQNHSSVVRVLPILNYCQSSIQNALVQRGVVPIKGTLEGQTVAGRLTLFLDNWTKVSQDRWIQSTERMRIVPTRWSG